MIPSGSGYDIYAAFSGWPDAGFGVDALLSLFSSSLSGSSRVALRALHFDAGKPVSQLLGEMLASAAGPYTAFFCMDLRAFPSMPLGSCLPAMAGDAQVMVWWADGADAGHDLPHLILAAPDTARAYVSHAVFGHPGFPKAAVLPLQLEQASEEWVRQAMEAVGTGDNDRVTDVLSAAYRDMVFRGISVFQGPVASADMVHGWENHGFADFMQHAISHLPQAASPVVIELGSWLGRSTNKIAAALKQHGCVGAKVIAVDTWLGSAEHWTTMARDVLPKLARRNGYPTLYRAFLSIAKTLNNDDVIVPLPLPTQHAVHVLKHQAVSADIVYVDAAHDEPAAYTDVSEYWELLKEGGHMVGDDWDLAGVRAAVERFCKERQLTLLFAGGVWCIQKPASTLESDAMPSTS
jgi:predicted O-methyltransferase YrrM